MKIYFTHPDPALLDDQALRQLCGWHWWKQNDTDAVFGVAIPHQLNKVDDLVDRLTALGCELLPALNDSTTKVSDKTVAHVGKHGVTNKHTARDAAAMLHSKSGFPPLRPHYH
jgi:hypothetical protein